MFNKTVYLHDTDALQNVYYSKILEWLEEVRMDVISKNYKPLTELIIDGVVIIPAKVNMDFKRPMKLGDIVTILTNIQYGKITIDLQHKVQVNNIDCVLIDIQMVYLKDGRPSRIPEELKLVVDSLPKEF